MHIPDNYLSPSTCAVIGAAMIPVWKVCVAKVKKEISKKKMPLLGIGAAFSFLVMMFNVPLPGGTTGHAVGATLIAILLGPYAACLSVSIALFIQAFVFGDGGILAFGANAFNLAFVMPFTGYYIYKIIKNKIRSEKGEYAGAFIAAYVSLNIAALLTALEFGIQPLLFKDSAGLPVYCPYPISIAVPAMVIPHLLVAGFIEAFITYGIYAFIKKVSPGIVYEGEKTKLKPIFVLGLIMILLTPLGLLAEGTAWGEWGADEINSVVTNSKELGFVPRGIEQGFSFKSLMPDYTIQGVPGITAYILSGVVGVSIFIIFFKIIASKNKRENI